MKSLISVIVPIYNIKNYISRCIDSIIGQTYTNLEIILVDDGSTDGSGKICDEYAEKDIRIKVFHKTNGGLSDARNYALDRMSGDLVMFVDGDDYIHPQMAEIMLNIKVLTGVDLVACDFERKDETVMDRHYGIDNIDYYVTSSTKALQNIIQPKVVAWNKLYSSSLMNNLRYPVGRYHEDEFLIHQILYKSSKIAIINQKLYFYTVRSDSIMGEISVKHVYDSLEALDSRCAFCYEHRWTEVMTAVVEQYCNYCINYFIQIKEGKYPNLGKDMMELLYDRECTMLGRYSNLKVGKQYAVFARNPQDYIYDIRLKQKKQEIKDRILYIPRKIYHMIIRN